MTTFTTYKRWTLNDGHDESELVALIAGQIVPHYQTLDEKVQLGLQRIHDTRSYQATQRWPSRDYWERLIESEQYAAWFDTYAPILAEWDELMSFESEWEVEEVTLTHP